jgi:hypothetical protein
VKQLLIVLLITAAFALVSCGEKTESVTDETATGTQVAKTNESPVSTCEGNVCTQEVASSRECAVDGKCPGQEYAKGDGHICTAECGENCSHAKGATCPCGGTGDCMFAKERGTEAACEEHVCTAECSKDCPYAKEHVCTKDCPENCPHAKAAEPAQTSGCNGCPLKTSCKSGS